MILQLLHLSVVFALWGMVISSSIVGFDNHASWSCFVNLVSMTGSVMHACWYLTDLLILLLCLINPIRNHGVVVLYKHQFKLLFWMLGSIASFTTHQVLMVPHMCSGTSGIYVGDLTTAGKIYLTFIILMGASACMHCIVIISCIILFVKRRGEFWERMQEIEAAIKIHPAIYTILDHPFNSDYKHQFSDYWANIDQADIVERLDIKIDDAMDQIIGDIDKDKDNHITETEFKTYVSSNKNLIRDILKVETILSCPHSLYTIDEKTVDSAWNMLSTNGEFSKDKLYRVLNSASRMRKRFAHMLVTDNIVLRWQLIFLTPVLHGIGGILIAQLWGYHAIDTGLDLLKLYLMILTWAAGVLEYRLTFVILMATQRPYNVGDIIQLGGELGNELGPTRVGNITTNFTQLRGLQNTWVSNVQVLSSSSHMHNLTASEKISDNLRIGMPVHVPWDICDIVHDAVIYFAKKHLNYGIDTDPHSIRIEWTESTNDSKILTVCWSYRTIVNDVSNYKHMRTNVRNAIMKEINDKLTLHSIIYVASQGGAFNERIELRDLDLSSITKFKSD